MLRNNIDLENETNEDLKLNKNKTSLINKDYQLHEALMVLKAMHILNNTKS